MNLEQFVQRFAEEFDETPAESFTSETAYRELAEWSSLTALSIISMVDDEFEKRVTGGDLRSVKTIKELFELIQSKN